MDCKQCGRKNCTMPSVVMQLCQVCYNYTPDKLCSAMLQDFLPQPNGAIISVQINILPQQ